jgi:hypothetical protein
MVAMIVIAVLLACPGVMTLLQATSPPVQSTDRSSACTRFDQGRRAVADHGVGGHVVVKLCSGERLAGHIRDIGDNDFVFDPDGPDAPMRIAYGDVRQLAPILRKPIRRSRLTPGQMVMAVLVAVALVVHLLECHDTSC